MTISSWTVEQSKVIRSLPESRLLVDAGPGTGKTATACGRVAWLIEECGVEPTHILMTSFTNAAVYELRRRVAGFLQDPERAVGLRISTLDSFSWYLRAGFRSRDIGFSSYEENIDDAAKLIELDASTREYLQEIRHFVLDEAQDITGNRVKFIMHILEALSPNCGVSIFSDDAQAIYGFSEDGRDMFFGNTLPEEIRSIPKWTKQFHLMSLDEVHRTSDEKLKALFAQGRQMLIGKNDEPIDDIYRQVRGLISDSGHQQIGLPFEVLMDSDKVEALGPSPLLLFRRRVDALQAGHYLGATPRRMRLSGYPLPLQPWIARCFWDCEDERVSQSQFVSLCESRLDEESTHSLRKWKLLHDEAGVDDTRISLRRLANILSRPNVSTEFCLPEYGVDGPTLGTIHASKGREMENVVLFMPAEPNFAKIEEDEAYSRVLEEARVLFVGGTRAKNTLIISAESGKSFFRRGGTLYRNERAFSIKKLSGNPKVAIEVGKKEDITAEGLVGTSFFSGQDEAILAQKALWRRRHLVVPLQARLYKGESWTYSASIDYRYSDERYTDSLKDRRFESVLFYFADVLNRDIWMIGNNFMGEGKSFRPPNSFRYFFSMGARSMVLSSDNPLRDRLNEPWSRSGFLLAPLIVGYPDLYLSTFGARNR